MMNNEQVKTEHDAMLRIQELLDGVEWSPDTLDEIATVMRAAGYVIGDIDELGDDDDACEYCAGEGTRIDEHGRMAACDGCDGTGEAND